MNVTKMEVQLLDHCYFTGLLKPTSSEKKKNSILDSLIAATVRSGMTDKELDDCIRDIKADKVLDVKFFEKGGDVKKYILPRWREFCNRLWGQRSVGLGTPNAASGEGELLFAFISPQIQKLVKGDIYLNGENIELKGEQIRVNVETTGKEFRRRTLKLAREFGLEPNITHLTGLEAVELEKPAHKDHWKAQLETLPAFKQRRFILNWLKTLDVEGISEFIIETNAINNILDGGFNQKELIRTIVKLCYKSMVVNREFNKMVILGDGSNAKIVSDSMDDFNEKIDNGEFIIRQDYFRVNQNTCLGWYIE
jgi:hypothetical protein